MVDPTLPTTGQKSKCIPVWHPTDVQCTGVLVCGSSGALKWKSLNSCFIVADKTDTTVCFGLLIKTKSNQLNIQ